MPDALQHPREELDEDVWSKVEGIVGDALDAFDNFREVEGASIEKDFKAGILIISEESKNLDPLLDARLNTIKSRISAKLTDVLQSVDFDRDRLEQEMIYFIEKLDVSEEKVRLKNHCSYFIDTMNSEEFNGKKLGFISQELGREINTMGSKANHTEIQKLVVQMKDALEKIKEQTLNVL